MMVYDLEGNILESYDLTKGYLQPKTVIKPEAAPIDNVEKCAWEDGDYQEIQVYIPFANDPAPTRLDRLEAQLVYTAMMTGTLTEGVLA